MAKPSERGFTLVEVLVAVVVSALLITILLDGSVTAKERQKNQIVQSKALLVAKANIDNLRSIDGEPNQTNGANGNLIWKLQEIEIARDPRQTYALVEAQIIVGKEEQPELVQLQKRYLKSLISR